MDSGSGSLQSSSGGDDEYDSRSAVSFMNGARFSHQQLFDEHTNNNKTPTMMIAAEDPPPPVFSASGTPTFLIAAEEPTAARNTKKRSRASRRAPTTVLTTDTTNFRAMVQEFTGIPSLSFSNSPFTRRRLDLFGGSVRSSETPSPPPPYNFRFPFSEKLQFPPPPTARNNLTSPSTDSSSFYTSNPRFPFSIPPILGSKSDLIFIEQPKMGFFQEPQNPIFSDQPQLHNGGAKDSTFNGDYSLSLRDRDEGAEILASTSNYHAGKGPETAGRESASWICSSQWK